MHISVFIAKGDEKDTIKHDKLWVRNNGEVTARNIELKALEDFYGEEEVISFRSVDTLPKGKTGELKIERRSKANAKITHGPDMIFTQNFLSDLKMESLRNNLSTKLIFKTIFRLTFENIFGDSYSADVIFKDEELLINNFEKE